MDDYVIELKKRCRIEDIIEETVGLQRHSGRGYTRGENRGVGEHSLVVNMDKQYFVWNGNAAYGSGDVINWVMTRDRVDFKRALEILAQKVGMEPPKWSEEQKASMKAVRVREDALSVAQRVFERWLWKDEKALAYARDRGWTDETIRSITLSEDKEKITGRGAGLGFTGWGTSAEYEEMKKALAAATDLHSPAVVSILGMKKGVQAWCQRHGITPKSSWIANDYIPSMMGWGKTVGLIYPHFYFGRVTYLSRRHLELDEEKKKLVGSDNPKSYNLPIELGGKRKMFYNHVYAPNTDRLVLVEGQADAVTFGQWGIDAVAIAGTSWIDHAEEIGRSRDSLKERDGELVLATDMDEAGRNALRGKNGDWDIADVVGAEARIALLPTNDANDLLQKFVTDGVELETQREGIENLLVDAKMLPVVAAEAARDMRGSLENAKKMKAMTRAFELIAQVDIKKISLLLAVFTKATGMGVRDFNRMLKAVGGKEAGSKETVLDTVEMLGGGGSEGEEDKEKGWYLEYMFDPDENKAVFAYRDPNGSTGTAPFLDIKNIRYIPSPPDPIIQHGAVVFPSDMGELKSERELAGIIEVFLRKYILFDDEVSYRLSAYYVMLTWLYDCFPAIPYLRARGKTDTGKSEVMLRLGHLCYRMIISTGISTTASYKNAIDHYRGTMFIDEVDISDKDDERIVLLNVGAMTETCQ